MRPLKFATEFGLALRLRNKGVAIDHLESKTIKVVAFTVAGVLATQLMLGCQPADKPEEDLVPKVNVPTGLEHPPQLVGTWSEAKGKQTVKLDEDGSLEILSKISIGAAVTKGASQAFDNKVTGKWGVKDTQFYFTDMKDSPPLAYDWSASGEKFYLNNSGSKLIYTRVKTPDSKKK